jgi:hypothetical protein
MEKKALSPGVVIGAIVVALALLGFVVFKAMSGPIGDGVDPNIAKLQAEAEASRMPNGGQPAADPNAAAQTPAQGTTGFSPGREGAR